MTDHHWRDWSVWSDACYLWRLSFFQTVRRQVLSSPRVIVVCRWTSLWRFWKSILKTYHEWLDEIYGSSFKRSTVRTVCPLSCDLAASTRHTIDAAIGTGVPNSIVFTDPTWFQFLNPLLLYSAAEEFVICILKNLNWSISSRYLFSQFIFFMRVWLYDCMFVTLMYADGMHSDPVMT